ncbi:MAG: polysaccharide biosynthesis tyrosine autokinase [Candidatus Rifleibacteriota bacterium]
MIQESLIEGISRSLRKNAGLATIIVGLAVLGSVILNRYFPAEYQSQALLRVMTTENSETSDFAAAMNGIFSQNDVLIELARQSNLSADEVINKNVISFSDAGSSMVKLTAHYHEPSELTDITKSAIKILSDHFLLYSDEKKEFEIKAARRKVTQLEQALKEARDALVKASTETTIKVDELTLQLEDQLHQLEERIELNSRKLQTTSKTKFYYEEEENDNYRKLSKDLNKAQKELANLFKTYKSKHPKVKKCKSQIGSLNKKLKKSITKVRKEKANKNYLALSAEIESDREKLGLIRGELKRTRLHENSQENLKENQINNINQRIRALESLHQKQLLALEEIRINRTTTSGKISVLKNSANKPSTVGFSAVQRDCIALLSGVLIAVFLLYSPAPVRTEIVSVSGEALAGAVGQQYQVSPQLRIESIETILEVPALSSEPLALPAPEIDAEPTNFDERLIALNNPDSPALVPYKSLVSNLQINISESQTRIVLIGSARAGIGRTTLLANCAILLAQAGYSVLMLDANFRNPVLHRVFDLENISGLSEALQNGFHPSQIQKTFVENLHLMSSGIAPQNPVEFLGSPEMIEILSELKRRVEVILIDTAPLLEYPDTGIMAGQSGAMVFMHNEKDSKKDLKASRKLLKSINAKIFGYVKS